MGRWGRIWTWRRWVCRWRRILDDDEYYEDEEDYDEDYDDEYYEDNEIIDEEDVDEEQIEAAGQMERSGWSVDISGAAAG